MLKVWELVAGGVLMIGLLTLALWTIAKLTNNIK